MAGPTWVAIPKPGDYLGYGSRDFGTLTDVEKAFVAGHDLATTIAESEDPHADYSYCDWALCELDGVFYAFETSGCSCPSPSETWDLKFHGDREAMIEWLRIVDTKVDYVRQGEAFAEFLRRVEMAGWTLREPAPQVKAKYDW